MWDFSWYTSKEWAFSFSRGVSKTTGAGVRAGIGVEVGARASKKALKILYKSSSEYLGILVGATRATVMGSFVFEGPAGWLSNLSPNLEGREELGKAIKGAIEICFWRRHLRPRTQVIFELISYKNMFPNGLADLLGMEKLEL